MEQVVDHIFGGAGGRQFEPVEDHILRGAGLSQLVQVGDSSSRWETVQAGGRQFKPVGDSWGRWETVHKGRRWETVGCHYLDNGTPTVLTLERPLMGSTKD